MSREIFTMKKSLIKNEIFEKGTHRITEYKKGARKNPDTLYHHENYKKNHLSVKSILLMKKLSGDQLTRISLLDLSPM